MQNLNPEISALRSDALKAVVRGLAPALPAGRWRTRFAPAPTGHLHLGHVVNAIHVWGVARACGGHVILRIEDHDRTRSRSEYERSQLDDLDWLGLRPDVASTNEFRRGTTVYRQSDNLERYARVLSDWDLAGLSYPCICSRTDVANSVSRSGDPDGATEMSSKIATTFSVPAATPSPVNVATAQSGVSNIDHTHGFTSELRYPGTCRDAMINPATTPARRARMPHEPQHLDDIVFGQLTQVADDQCGDVLLRDRNGNFTYHFAVVVDDFDQQVDVIIRGEDLKESTGRQLQLTKMLGETKRRVYLHHGLLMRADGMKLSKSLGDNGIRELRAAGFTAEQVLGRAAFQASLITRDVALSASDLPALFAAD